MVFGATSANMRNTMVQTIGAIATPLSPNTSNAMSVAIDAAEKLTRLLPIRMTPSSLSGRSSSFDAYRALE